MNDRLNLVKFFKQYPTEVKAERYFINLRWGKKICCPSCGSESITEKKNRLPMPYRCKRCRKHFSVRTNTILSESKISLQKWLLAIYIMTNNTKGISSIRLAEYLKTTQKTAWLLGQKIRKTWLQDS